MLGLFKKKKPEAESTMTLSLAELCADGFCAVVGESHYQETLRTTRQGCTVGQEGRLAFSAALVPEPGNPYDSNAVAIYSPEGKVGYLSRDDAIAYEELLAEVTLRGYHGGACEAYLTGGEPDKPSFGVVLCLADPEDCLAELGVSSSVDPTGDGNEWRGSSSGISETGTDPPSGLEGRDLSEELSDEPRFSRRPPGYERRVAQGQAILAAEEPDLEAAAACFREAAGEVQPGFDRAYVLGQLASIYLRLEQPASAVQTLLSEPDWPHHVPAAFATLMRAAVDAEQLEPFRWLATRPGEYHEASVTTLDRGLQLALYRKHYDFAEQLLAVVSELTTPGDPLTPLLRGLLREKQDQSEEAINAYLEAASNGSSDPRCFRRLTLLLDKAKRREEAAEWCRRALALDLEASARQEIEKRLARLEAPPGKKRSASVKVIPLYLRRGDAVIDRLASFPVMATDSVQGGQRVWGYGRRSGSPYLWMRETDEVDGLDVELDFDPRSIHCHGSGEICLVVGIREGQGLGRVVAPNGARTALEFDGEPGTVICLDQGFVLSLHGGPIESYAWTGERLWKARLGQGVFAYWLAADANRVVASHLNRIYELDLGTGQVRGRAEIKEEPQELAGELVTITFSMGDPWVRGLGFAYGRALVTDGTRLFEIGPGPRLTLVEPGDQDEHLQLALTDEDGKLLAFQGNEFLRLVKQDAHLGPKVPVPWARHELALLPDGRLVSYGSRDLTVLHPTGAETHRFEAANNIRSLRASQDGIRLVVGRDLLRVGLL